MKNKARFFKKVTANLVIAFVIIGMFMVTFNSELQTVISQSSYEAIYRGSAENANVSLMVNVYWGTEYLQPMLDIMEEKNVTCTFFVGGTWAEDNTNLLEDMIAKGHEIGNHGYFHKDMDKLSYEGNQKEIYVNHELIKETVGVDMNLFAPPSGAYNSTTLSVAKNLGYKTIMWSKDTIDWRDKDENIILSRATTNIKNGELILMHPTHCTLLALNGIIDNLQAKNFNLTTVTECIA